MNGSNKSYSKDAIRRVPCIKCKAPSKYQFRICSTRRWTAVCPDCDLEINRIVAMWAWGKRQGKEVAEGYAAKRK